MPTVQRFHKGLRQKSRVTVTKNTLMRVACRQVEGWNTVADKGCTVRGRVTGDEGAQGRKRGGEEGMLGLRG